MQFTGDVNDVCPISYTPVRDIMNPVGFDANHAFECDSVVLWVKQHRACNPITTLPVEGRVVDVLFPLIVDGDNAHVNATQIKLSQAGDVMPSKYVRIRRGLWGLYANMLLFLVAVYVLKSSDYIMACVVGASFAHVAYSTRKTYPRDGMQVVFSLVSIMVDILAITNMITQIDFGMKLALAQCIVLCVRLFIDTRQMTM